MCVGALLVYEAAHDVRDVVVAGLSGANLPD